MSLVTCAQCAKPISVNASNCPHCEYIFDDKLRNKITTHPCRVCGEMLNIDEYRSISFSSKTEWVRGTSKEVVNSFVHHRHCPNCGEPTPLLMPGDKFIHKAAFFSIFFAVTGLLWFLLGEKGSLIYSILFGITYFAVGWFKYPALFEGSV